MRKISLALAAAVMVCMAAPSYAAEPAPYFGATTHNGNYWNGSTPSTQWGQGVDGAALARAHCHWTRTGDMSGSHRVCE
jgi:hypothetical protein